MNNIQIDYKKLKNDTAIIITYVNKEGIQERTKLSLRKIKVMLITTGLTIATLVAGFALGKKVGENYQTRDEKNQESLANLDDNEEFIEEHLVAYNIALSDYENIMKQPNRNEHYAIEKRVEVISAIRNLQKVANNLMKVKVLEGLPNLNEYTDEYYGKIAYLDLFNEKIEAIISSSEFIDKCNNYNSYIDIELDQDRMVDILWK